MNRRPSLPTSPTPRLEPRHTMYSTSLYVKMNALRANSRQHLGYRNGRGLPRSALLSANLTNTHISDRDPLGFPIKAGDINCALAQLEVPSEDALEEVNVRERLAAVPVPASGGPREEVLEACASALPGARHSHLSTYFESVTMQRSSVGSGCSSMARRAAWSQRLPGGGSRRARRASLWACTSRAAWARGSATCPLLAPRPRRGRSPRRRRGVRCRDTLRRQTLARSRPR